MSTLVLWSSVARADPAPPPEAPTLVPQFSLAAQQDRYDEDRLVLEPPWLPRAGIPYVVRYAEGTPMNTVSLLMALDDPALNDQFRRRQNTNMVAGTAQLLVGVAAVYGANFAEGEIPELVTVGLALGGGVLTYTSIAHFVRLTRRSKHPATWLDEGEVRARVEAYNARLALELGVEADPP